MTGAAGAASSLSEPSNAVHLYDSISLEILWSRLIASVDEAAGALVRTSFSPNVREANDFACGLLDASGASLAENTLGIPGFLGILPMVQREVLRKFPIEEWLPGDTIITNDPWLNTGHLPDIAIVRPVFHRGKLVAFAGNIAHAHDIGGALFGANAREVYEEGISIPILRLYRGGVRNETLYELLRDNVRSFHQVWGDLQAQIAAADVCAERVTALMEEYDLPELTSLTAAVLEAGERSMRRAIEALPDGEYRHEIETDGYGDPTRIAVRVTVAGDRIEVDYSGSSSQVDAGINCVLNYTYVYTAYPLKVALDPATPRNDGTYRPITVSAPRGSILNADKPAAVNGRHLTAHFLYAAVFGALADVLPNSVIADCGSTPNLRTIVAGRADDGRRFHANPYANGGMGARSSSDGLSCTCFPSNRSASSIELTEHDSGIRFLKKEMLADSGGTGKYRGGLGQELSFMTVSPHESHVSVFADRVHHPAAGILGGGAGTPARIFDEQGRDLDSKGRTRVAPGVAITIQFPGGGGFGTPLERDRALVASDLADGYISPAGAVAYGMELADAMDEVRPWRP